MLTALAGLAKERVLSLTLFRGAVRDTGTGRRIAFLFFAMYGSTKAGTSNASVFKRKHADMNDFLLCPPVDTFKASSDPRLQASLK